MLNHYNKRWNEGEIEITDKDEVAIKREIIDCGKKEIHKREIER